MKVFNRIRKRKGLGNDTILAPLKLGLIAILLGDALYEYFGVFFFWLLYLGLLPKMKYRASKRKYYYASTVQLVLGGVCVLKLHEE